MTKKQGFKIVLFLLILGILIYPLLGIFQIAAEGDTLGIKKRYNEFYGEPENTWDCVMVGTSCVDREWIAPLAWKNYGMTVYAMNTDVQPLYLTTNVLTEVRKTQDIKLAVVDVRGIKMKSLRPDEVRIRRVTDCMRFSANQWEAVNKGIQFHNAYYSDEEVLKKLKKNKEEVPEPLDAVAMHVPFVKYHSRWESGLRKIDFVGTDTIESTMKGVYDFENTPFTVEEIIPTFVTDKQAELNELQTGVLDEILEYGKETDLELLFIASPTQLSKKEQPEINAALAYLEEQGANVINYNTEEMYEEIGINFSEDLYNRHHLNSRGAVKFTEYFSKYLNDTYHFPDKRGQEGYQEWDMAYENFVAFYEDGWANKYTYVYPEQEGGSDEDDEEDEDSEDNKETSEAQED